MSKIFFNISDFFIKPTLPFITKRSAESPNSVFSFYGFSTIAAAFKISILINFIHIISWNIYEIYMTEVT